MSVGSLPRTTAATLYAVNGVFTCSTRAVSRRPVSACALSSAGHPAGSSGEPTIGTPSMIIGI